MRNSAGIQIFVAIAALYLGYHCPLPLHIASAGSSKIGLGDGSRTDPRLNKWIDFRSFRGKDSHAVLRQIADDAGLKLDVDWTQIPISTIDQTFATHNWEIQYSGGPVEQALDALLPTRNDGRRTWTVADGTLILPAEKYASSLESTTSVRIYDITATFPRVLERPSSGGLVPQWYEMQMYSRPITPEEWQGLWKEAISSNIAGLIEAHVDPDSWSNDSSWNADGRVQRTGDITTGPGFLIIRQTPEGHRRIERFLQLLNGEQ